MAFAYYSIAPKQTQTTVAEMVSFVQLSIVEPDEMQWIL